MRSEDGVDQSRLAETSLAFLVITVSQSVCQPSSSKYLDAMRSTALTDTHDIKLKSTLQEFLLDLGGDAVETDMAAREDGARRSCNVGCRGHSEDARMETGDGLYGRWIVDEVIR